jgi:Putative peptidoglycan binding domain/CHAP domain
MAVLRQGTHGAEVRRLQSLLNANKALQRPLVADGHFGNLTHIAVSTFQQTKGLTVDGVVGAETWRALEAHPLTPVIAQYRVGPQEALADIAAPYVGATEAAGNRMGEDARMREIFEADDLANRDGTTDGYAWCCAFVSVCVQRLLIISPMYPGVRAPRVASVHLFRTRWAPDQNCLIFTPTSPHVPHKGDIVVYTFSHIGIVEGTGSGSLQTIEGNTNEQGSREGTTCTRKQRALSLVRCFIRLPVAANSC